MIEKSKLKKLADDFSLEDLEQELLARGAKTSFDEQFIFPDGLDTHERQEMVQQMKALYQDAPMPSAALQEYTTRDIAEVLRDKLRIWGADDRVDYFQVEDEKVQANADRTAVICVQPNLMEGNGDYSILQVTNYGKHFNLVEEEAFREQHMILGPMCTGFLVKSDVIATCGHASFLKHIKDLRVVFGFRKTSSDLPADCKIAKENVYQVVETIERKDSFRLNREDWALFRLDRPVKGISPVCISSEIISSSSRISLYVTGYPRGLPLKYADSAWVSEVKDNYFGTHLDIYSGNSGSPVFNSKTHEVVGIVIHCDNQDFRWTGSNWISVQYPNRDIYSKGPECTLVKNFMERLAKLE